MKRTVLRTLLIFAALGCAACSSESSFFSNFSMQKLVEKNKSRAGLVCAGLGGGGGGIGTGRWGFGQKEFRSHKGDSCDCSVKPDAVNHFDEPALIAALRQDVERAIIDSRGTIIETGNPSSSSFYFRYTLAHTEGRVEISSRKIRDDYYSFIADLEERSKGLTK